MSCELKQQQKTGEEKNQKRLDRAITAVQQAQAGLIYGVVEVHLQHGVIVRIKTSITEEVR